MDTNEVIGPDGRSYHYNPNVFLPPPQCGNGDVSGALSAVLQKFKDKFEALEKNKETQRINEICCNIHKPFEFISWDIMDLTMIGYRSATSFSGFHNIVHVGNGENCEWTVQVGGRCFYGGAVNYTLWGYGFKLCSKYNKNATLERAKWKSSFWKNLKYRGALASEAKGFVEYGWNSGSGTLPNSGGCASCIIPTSIPVYFNGKVFFNSLYIQ